MKGTITNHRVLYVRLSVSHPISAEISRKENHCLSRNKQNLTSYLLLVRPVRPIKRKLTYDCKSITKS